MPVSTLPSQSFVWGELPDRFMAELKANEAELWEYGGIIKMFGPVGDNYAGASEGNLLMEQVVKFLLIGLALDLENRERENRIGRSVGRPKDVITPYFAPEMLGLFLCYQGSGGRHSVATSIGLNVNGTVRAEGDLDWRGTLAVDKEAPVGFKEIRLRFELESDASDEELETLERLTERYCVVYQTLVASPSVSVSMERS